jgi:hypothetical protein
MQEAEFDTALKQPRTCMLTGTECEVVPLSVQLEMTTLELGAWLTDSFDFMGTLFSAEILGEQGAHEATSGDSGAPCQNCASSCESAHPVRGNPNLLPSLS